MFEPIHGSAPDIAGQGIANPISAIWSAALLLEHLGEETAAQKLEASIYAVIAEGNFTADLGGTAKTSEIGDAIVRNLAPAHHVAE